MVRWVRLAAHCALLATILCYNALPFFGEAWHDFVPEHDHWYLGGSPLGGAHAHQHVHPGGEVLEIASVDVTPAPQGSVVHAANPGSVLSALAVSLSLDDGITLAVPPGPSQHVAHPAFSGKPSPLVPQDPPPEAG